MNAKELGCNVFEKLTCYDKYHRVYISPNQKKDIKKWFVNRGADIGEERVNYELEYNDAYHHYDLSCFMVDFNAIHRALQQEGFKFEEAAPTWAWRYPTEDTKKWVKYPEDLCNGRICIPGKRFWIYPKPELDYSI
jgi:hypothetical protein